MHVNHLRYRIQGFWLCWLATSIFLLPAVLTFCATDKAKSQVAISTSVNGPRDIAYTDDGQLYILELEDRISVLDLQQGTIQPFSPATHLDPRKLLESPRAMAPDHHSGIYISTSEIPLVYFQPGLGVSQIIAANNDNTLHASALAVTPSGNVLVADSLGHRILLWDSATKKLQVIAGSGRAGFAGDGGPAQIALLRFPRGVATLSNGDILIADSGNCRLRLVDHRNSTIRTIAGTGNCSSGGDGGQAYKASMAPDHIAVDRADNIYVVESGADRVRRIAPNGIIINFVGNGKRESSGDNGPANKAGLANPSGIAVDANGNVYIAEFVGNRIRQINVLNGTITTVAGNGLPHREDLIL